MAHSARDRERQWRRTLLAWARRHSRRGAEAEDLLQDALLATLEAGRWQDDEASLAYAAGAVRHLALHAARSAVRRQVREAQYAWHAHLIQGRHPGGDPAEACERGGKDLWPVLHGLPASLRLLALLVLTGHTRAEAAWLLRLPDTALRQRLVALKKRLRAAELSAPGEPLLRQSGRQGIGFGRVRQALLPALRRTGAHLGTHDPDGRPLLVGRLPALAARALAAGSEHGRLTNAGHTATDQRGAPSTAPSQPGAHA